MDRFCYLSFIMVSVVLLCLFLIALWSPAGKRADLLAVVFVMFCRLPKCALVHIRIKGEVGSVKLV